MGKKKKEVQEVDEVSTNWEDTPEVKPKKKRSSAYSKTKGSAYERQIVNELKALTGNENISTSRSSSKKLDDMKIDINDEDGVLPCYIQTKKTQTTVYPVEYTRKERGQCKYYFLWRICYYK